MLEEVVETGHGYSLHLAVTALFHGFLYCRQVLLMVDLQVLLPVESQHRAFYL